VLFVDTMRRLPPGYGLTRRDGVLILIGASVVYIFTFLFQRGDPFLNSTVVEDSPFANQNAHFATSEIPTNSDPSVVDLGLSPIPETKLITHAPGWTLFENLYMSNGTLYIVSSDPGSFPKIRMITSTGHIALNTPENIRLREPTDNEMQIINPDQAATKWGGDITNNERNRIWSIEGISVSPEKST